MKTITRPPFGPIQAALLLLLLVLTLLLLLQPVIELPFRVPKDINEGWNAFWADRALTGQPLYPSATSFIANNYPPLSFYLVGLVGQVIGDNVIAGRLVALISFLIVGVNTGLVVHLLTRSKWIAMFSSLLLMSYMAAHHQGYVGMNDPQWLAHALMMTALLVFLAGGEKGWLLALSLLLMLAAGLIKHNLIPLPLAITVWLFIYRRAVFYRWIVASAIMLALVLAALYRLYGENILIGVLQAPREYSLMSSTRKLDRWMSPLIIYIAAAFAALLAGSDDRRYRLIFIYTLISAVWGIAISGGTGVDYNAIFDLIVGLVILSGLMLARFPAYLDERNLHSRLALPTVMFLLLLPVLLKAPVTLVNPWRLVLSLNQRQAAMKADIKFLSEREGPVICEFLVLCYWAGKSFEMDFFNTGQKLSTRAMKEATLTDLLSKQHFSVIQLSRQSGSSLWPESINRQISSAYRIGRVSDANGVLMVAVDASN